MADMSLNLAEAIALDFLEGSVDLTTAKQDVGTTYQIKGDRTACRTEHENGTIQYYEGLPTASFIGGVAYSPFEEGNCHEDDVTPANIAKVCFAMGKLITTRTEVEG
jgi:hypothetical protein